MGRIKKPDLTVYPSTQEGWDEFIGSRWEKFLKSGHTDQYCRKCGKEMKLKNYGYSSDKDDFYLCCPDRSSACSGKNRNFYLEYYIGKSAVIAYADWFEERERIALQSKRREKEEARLIKKSEQIKKRLNELQDKPVQEIINPEPIEKTLQNVNERLDKQGLIIQDKTDEIAVLKEQNRRLRGTLSETIQYGSSNFCESASFIGHC